MDGIPHCRALPLRAGTFAKVSGVTREPTVGHPTGERAAAMDMHGDCPAASPEGEGARAHRLTALGPPRLEPGLSRVSSAFGSDTARVGTWTIRSPCGHTRRIRADSRPQARWPPLLVGVPAPALPPAPQAAPADGVPLTSSGAPLPGKKLPSS